MLQRPKVGETEEDLLQQEEEFLKQSGKAPTQKRNIDGNDDEKKSPVVPGIIGEVVGRTPGPPCPPDPDDESKRKGFPALFKIDPDLKPDKEGKKSLFVLQMEKNKNVSDNATAGADERNLSTGEAEPVPGCSTSQEDAANASGSTENDALSDDKKSVHEENLVKLEVMPEPEILEAQRALNESLNPILVTFLRNRSRRERNGRVNQEPRGVWGGDKNLPQDDRVKEILRNYVGDKWLNMDFLETEKLEWVGDIPGVEALQPKNPYSARFDFKGELQPYVAEIDVTNALYHHGDEPERPGYTIQELYQLSRSKVRQQRILALNTLGNIIYKSKLGYYDACFDGYLLPKLVDAHLFLLLRFSIDVKSLIIPTMNCLRKLLYNDSDEYCLDRCLGITEEDVQPLIINPMEVDPEDERELPDDTIVQCDMIRGAFRTDLVYRIVYILNYHPCDRETIKNGVLCLIRIARHSVEYTEQMVQIPNLLYSVYKYMAGDEPIYEGFKLFRVLSGQSWNAAMEIGSRYNLEFSASFLNLDSLTGLSKVELRLLKLECIYLWRNILRCGLLKSEFCYWSPCFVRFLRVFAERVDIYAESDFDFELFAAMMSMVRYCISQRLPIDNNYPDTMYLCLEKWMNQLIQSQKFTYSSLKALGSCFSFFMTYFEIFGSDSESLSFIEKLNGLISTLLSSPLFETMGNRLTDYSHLIFNIWNARDPTNLPSLCSVYENGEDFVRIVNNQSTLPFFIYFAKYLLFSSAVIEQSKRNVDLFLNHPAIRRYIYEVMSMDKNTGNWFERYELIFLTDLLQLFFTVRDSMRLSFGFRLLPLMRVDEDYFVTTLHILTDNKIWADDNDLDYFSTLTDVFMEALFKTEFRTGYAMRYENELAGEDWAFRSLTKFCGNDVPQKVVKILRFLHIISTRERDLFEHVSYTTRYYHLSSVFLTDSNVFDGEIQREMQGNFSSIVQNRDNVDLSIRVTRKKSFYDFYTELITQYASVSYGMHIFAEFILFPLQNRFDASYRKLLWFEYFHVLKVIVLPYPSNRFIPIEEFVEPYETDESLLVIYLNSISTRAITKSRNPFVYNLAVSNINNYMRNASPDSTVFCYLSRRIRFTVSPRVRQDLLCW